MTSNQKLTERLFEQVVQQVVESVWHRKYSGPDKDTLGPAVYNIHGGHVTVDMVGSDIVLDLFLENGEKLHYKGEYRVKPEDVKLYAYVKCGRYWNNIILNWVRESRLYDLIEEWEIDEIHESITFTLDNGDGLLIMFDGTAQLYVGDEMVEFDVRHHPDDICDIIHKRCECSICTYCPRWFEWFEKQRVHLKQLQEQNDD
jgi:hypothetical protein